MKHEIALSLALVCALACGTHAAQPPKPALSQASSTIVPAPPEPTGASSEEASEARCALPFEAGHCKAALRVFAFDLEHGRCEEKIYGGCGGNENRFKSAEACEQACGCPAGQKRARSCAQCGPAGGCQVEQVSCLRECTKPEDCEGAPGGLCVDGLCQMACI